MAIQSGFSAQHVANAFVKQYYTILDKCPENAHKFYQESSLLGWPEPDGEMIPVTTLSGINDKIMSSDYKDWSVEIKYVDAQDSQDGGVIVSVTGFLTRKDSTKKYFNQAFFLAKQEKGFFVLNDIFRFVNVCESLTNVESHDDDKNDQPSQVENSVPDNSSVRHASSQTESEVDVEEVSALPVSKDTAPKVAASYSVVAAHQEMHSVLAPVSNIKQDVPKITYASVVAKRSHVTSPKSASVTSKADFQSVASTRIASAPPGDGASKISTPSSVVTKASAPSSNISPKVAVGNISRPKSPNTNAYIEGTGIYIGRLPYDVTKRGIVEVVKQFGPVRRNLDSIQIKRHEDGFCCGFVEFESADSARRAVETHHVYFGEKEAYIMYKKSSNQGNSGRGRSPSRGGIQQNNPKGRESREGANNRRFQSESRSGFDKGQARTTQQKRQTNWG